MQAFAKNKRQKAELLQDPVAADLKWKRIEFSQPQRSPWQQRMEPSPVLLLMQHFITKGPSY